MKYGVLGVVFLIAFNGMAQSEDNATKIRVYSANHYCGNESLSKEQLEKQHDKKQLSNFDFYAINLSKKASGMIEVVNWHSSTEAVIESEIESGEYLLLTKEDFSKIVKEDVEGDEFVLTGSYLRKLVSNSSARLYIPTDNSEELELVFWNKCAN